MPLLVYGDALQNGFTSNQWQDGTNDCILNLAYTGNKASGANSAELSLNHYCTVFFTQPGYWDAGTYIGGFDVGGYSYLEFDLYAMSPAQATFGISLAPNFWSTTGSQVLIENYVVPASQWQHVKIPMSDFSLLSGTLVEGLQLRNNDWQTNNNVYGHVLIDNISFTPNLDPPTVTSVSGGDLKHIKISFSKQVDPATAAILGNYAIGSAQDGAYATPLAPQSVSISPDKISVILTVPTRLQSGNLYQLVLKNIADRLTPPHTLAANTTANFTAQFNPLAINIDAASGNHPISPLIYGLSFAPPATLADLNFSLNRQGGNRASTYNWLENADNTASDWFFESISETGDGVPAGLIDGMVNDNKSSGSDSIITIPTTGWVAKLAPDRSKLASYSKTKYGPQTQADNDWFPDAGNGMLQSTGLRIIGNDPNDAYVPSDVSFQSGFVNYLIGQWGPAQSGGVKFYSMDNEPGIWSSTHVDIHPIGPTMEEIRDKTLAYGTMVKQQDPSAQVIGPEEDGWTRFLLSGYDSDWGSAHGWDMASMPDRSAHGGMDYVPWLLDQLRQNNQATGHRVLDILTLHWYPQSGEYYPGGISPNMMLMRNRSTRSLWDPNYTDESWINEKVYLIPRMKQWVNQYYPGTKVGITEYNWGAENSINGATTLADILGIFGREGLDMATYWTAPAAGTSAYQAMKLYRNYDGAKSTFGDTSVSDVVPNPDQISSFAALRTSDGALTIMVINKQLATDTAVVFNVSHFSGSGSAKAYQLTSAGTITNLGNCPYQNGSLEAYLPAQSVTLFVIPPVTALSPSQVATTTSGLVFSRVSQTFNGTVTVKNIGGGTLTGPFQIVFTGLTGGVSLVNPTGGFSGSSYLTVPGVSSLAPGQSATVSAKFNNPAKGAIHFTPAIYTGSLN
ncbi:glycoside hydrolase family 44 protein [Methylomagnum sp.]